MPLLRLLLFFLLTMFLLLVLLLLLPVVVMQLSFKALYSVTASIATTAVVVTAAAIGAVVPAAAAAPPCRCARHIQYRSSGSTVAVAAVDNNQHAAVNISVALPLRLNKTKFCCFHRDCKFQTLLFFSVFILALEWWLRAGPDEWLTAVVQHGWARPAYPAAGHHSAAALVRCC